MAAIQLGSGFPNGSEVAFSEPMETDPAFIFKRMLMLNKAQLNYDPLNDKFVNKLLQFYKLYQNSTGEKAYYLKKSCPSLYDAISLYLNPCDKRGLYIECGVLSKGEPEDIGAFVGLSEGTIELYQLMFFNVSDKLEQAGYVMGTILITFSDLSIVPSNDDVWRYMAFRMGWDIFKTYVATGRVEGAALRTMLEIYRYRESIKRIAASFMEPVASVSAAKAILDRAAYTMIDSEKQAYALSGGGSDVDPLTAIAESLKLEPKSLNSGEELPEAEYCELPEEQVVTIDAEISDKEAII